MKITGLRPGEKSVAEMRKDFNKFVFKLFAFMFVGWAGIVLPVLFFNPGGYFRAVAEPPAAVVAASPLQVYDVTTFGAINDGDPAHCAVNTAAIQQAFNAAAASPAPVYFPLGRGFAVNNGMLKLTAPNMVIFGCGSMGTVPDWAQTSFLAGYGPGSTITVAQGGSTIKGLAFRSDGQSGADASILITQTQVTVDDVFMDGPNRGIRVQFQDFVGGQVWLKNILIGGKIKSAGLDISAGGGAVLLDHIRTFNGDMEAGTPQPKYGVLVRSAGELIMTKSDICNCGTNLAIMPGIDGVANTYVQAVSISDCLFDNGNQDQICIRPMGSSFVLNANLVNVWCSSVNNGNGTWPGNGITVDGAQSHTAVGFPAICNVTVSNSLFQNSEGHCGGYFDTVTGLSVVNCGAWNNFVGFQTRRCTGVMALNKAGSYMPSALGFPQAGNKAYGILLEKSPMVFNPSDNALAGNGVGPYRIIP